MLILHQNSQSIHYLFLQTFKTHFPYKNKYASHNLNYVERFKKTKNETSSLTIANNLKLQIKRQQMDYGNTRRCDVLYTAGTTAASCGGANSRHTWLLRVCFPELNSPLCFRSICCRIVLVVLW